jgi:hypothetical protein
MKRKLSLSSSLFFTFFHLRALHVIFSGQTVDSHVMLLITGHFFHQGGIFTQRTNDVGIESGTVKVTGPVLFQQIQGSLVGADNEMFTVKAVVQFQISFVLGRPTKHKELEKSIFNGCHIFGVHSLFACELDLALKVAGHRRGMALCSWWRLQRRLRRRRGQRRWRRRRRR